MADRKSSTNGASARKITAPKRLKKTNPNFWLLRLYTAGRSPRSLAAFDNLERLCKEHLAGRYQIEVVDLIEQPKLAAQDQIVAVPTLVRRLPPPLRKIVGDLESQESTLVGLQLRPGPRRGVGA